VTVEFVVEQAGCSSCADLVREVLSDLGAVEAVEVDESADIAYVRLATGEPVTNDRIDALLADAAVPGHAYRVRPGSLTEVVEGPSG
jgi:copper chaperone CopZ